MPVRPARVNKHKIKSGSIELGTDSISIGAPCSGVARGICSLKRIRAEPQVSFRVTFQFRGQLLEPTPRRIGSRTIGMVFEEIAKGQNGILVAADGSE
jgi:hypothetical protein